MTVSKELLDILVCPLCKLQIVQAETGEYLDCKVCQQSFPVRGGIPVMLVEEAEKMSASLKATDIR